mmetsp:Transcript_24781/g.36349  ORF Transcript_24781/g.36349 Transcript_24781/m.36349 type:complete len:199 (-) Transcript_24781:156-752(-)|eukprot:CAMPEP_0195527834 /NCGR_PEP_ID=MMETSP0794_2-20130614/29750_1 /TAXON_ID=515487 /ORGANISM="Stephanopyxis turris, Strain CCMP 815" /LENGTH=198 /DNA_ID=CAMNT_0040658839 /DNA_START=78 /DNA_END=674 /DNA_ORIENTATION=+
MATRPIPDEKESLLPSASPLAHVTNDERFPREFQEVGPVAVAIPVSSLPSGSSTTPVPLISNEGASQEARIIPTYESVTSKSREESLISHLATAEVKAGTKNRQERLLDDRGRHECSAKLRQERDAITRANLEGNKRNREGLDIRENKWFVGEPEEIDKNTDIASYHKKGEGYEVSQYETSEYTTQDYNVSEYKSVYD